MEAHEVRSLYLRAEVGLALADAPDLTYRVRAGFNSTRDEIQVRWCPAHLDLRFILHRGETEWKLQYVRLSGHKYLKTGKLGRGAAREHSWSSRYSVADAPSQFHFLLPLIDRYCPRGVPEVGS